MSENDLLAAVCADTAAACAALGAPVTRIVTRGGGAAPLIVTYLFDEPQTYAAIMNDPEKKDRLIAAFMSAIVKNGYDPGEHPQLSFRFGIDL